MAVTAIPAVQSTLVCAVELLEERLNSYNLLTTNHKNLCSCQVMDALKMEFSDNSFDLVWACESGEHMPDKKAYVEEMTRVLAPGGNVS